MNIFDRAIEILINNMNDEELCLLQLGLDGDVRRTFPFKLYKKIYSVQEKNQDLFNPLDLSWTKVETSVEV